jgi:potassium-transporting ATPase KdpC subunit
MHTLIRPAVSLFVLLTLITGVLYPALITGIAQLAVPLAANGSLLFKDNKPVGSALIGQQFTQAKYFWGRLSATTPEPYNGLASGGSNLGPLNPALLSAAKSRAETLHNVDPDNTQPIPLDLVTTSASGLDPHISPTAADYQVERVACARNMAIATLHQLVVRHIEGRDFGFLGEPRVNVLRLNLALDALQNRP